MQSVKPGQINKYCSSRNICCSLFAVEKAPLYWTSPNWCSCRPLSLLSRYLHSLALRYAQTRGLTEWNPQLSPLIRKQDPYLFFPEPSSRVTLHPPSKFRFTGLRSNLNIGFSFGPDKPMGVKSGLPKPAACNVLSSSRAFSSRLAQAGKWKGFFVWGFTILDIQSTKATANRTHRMPAQRLEGSC